jgi:hypothetical protein
MLLSTSNQEVVKTLTDTIKVLIVNSPSTENYFLLYSAPLIALLAVFFSPLISYLTTKLTLSSQRKMSERTISSQVISVNRQDWINTLRDNVSQFVAIMFTLSLATEADMNTKEFFEKTEILFAIRFKLKLLINPKEDDHQKLDALIGDALRNVIAPEKERAKLRPLSDLRDDIMIVSQNILKREWERVKKVE